MKKFEYKVVDEYNFDSLEPIFNRLGKEGWEMCGVSDSFYLFKRETA